MNNTKKILTGVLALSLVSGLSACSSGDSSDPDQTTTQATTTTTQATVAINTEGLKDGEEEVLENAMSQLRDVELENKTVKWLAHYDLNPSTSGASKSVALEMFEQKYGGNIEWISTTWEQRYDALSTNVLGGVGVDIFLGDDVFNFPKGIVSGMFQPIDNYIDINDAIWQNVKSGMNAYSFGGKHFNMVTSVTAEEIVIYNKQTIEENGLDDPWELYKAGEWNWDKFKSMLQEFVDEDNDQYGLDGYWAENALLLSAGVPTVGTTEDGHLVCNLKDATLEKAMNFQYDLFNAGLVFNREQFSWSEQPAMMGDGRQLFYIVGPYYIQKAPETWETNIEPENVGVAPVPSPADSDPWQAAKINGFALCKGAANPEGAALYAECAVIGSVDEGAIAISDRKMKDDYQLSDEIIANLKEIDAIATKYPVVDLASGASTQIAGATTQGGDNVGVRAALHGTDWASNRESIADPVELAVNEVDVNLQNAIAEFE
ncbi:MAG: extracellular solute-binding protein [Ruminococcus sp.]|nr:extracellular solute-binding protein [Ruminococcus sp.]MCM1382645.1 extracellular solute-binding protein [Muribaculaceae bacterium]